MSSFISLHYFQADNDLNELKSLLEGSSNSLSVSIKYNNHLQ
jgi:hypothetical protein